MKKVKWMEARQILRERDQWEAAYKGDGIERGTGTKDGGI